MSRAERPIRSRISTAVSISSTTSTHSRHSRLTAVAGRFFAGVYGKHAGYLATWRQPGTPHLCAFTPSKNLVGGTEMGYELSRWAKNLEHLCLTPRTRQVLNAICLIADDEHGEFWMRSKRLIAEHFPDMSHGTYRNCLSRLVRNELLIKIEHGGGRTTYGGGKTTRYRVNSLVVENPHPAQSVLPDIIRSPEALPPTLERSNEQDVNATIEVQQRIAEWLSAGITHEKILETLKVTGETLLGSPVNMSSPDAEKRHEIEKHVTNDDKFQQNLSSSAGETVHEAEKHVTLKRNMSRIMTDFKETCHCQ